MKIIEKIKEKFNKYRKEIIYSVSYISSTLDILSYVFWFIAGISILKTQHPLAFIHVLMLFIGFPFFIQTLINNFKVIKNNFNNNGFNLQEDIKNDLLTIPSFLVGILQIYSYFKYYNYKDNIDIFIISFWWLILVTYYIFKLLERNDNKNELKNRIKKLKNTNNAEFLFTALQEQTNLDKEKSNKIKMMVGKTNNGDKDENNMV